MKVKILPTRDVRTVFRVQSETDVAIWYHVDLEEYDDNGQCDCPHFRNRLTKMLRRFPSRRWRCKHIEVARDFALDLRLLVERRRRLTEQRNQKHEQKHNEKTQTPASAGTPTGRNGVSRSGKPRRPEFTAHESRYSHGP